jgi:nucleotide-binding universal stress UspA family protein
MSLEDRRLGGIRVPLQVRTILVPVDFSEGSDVAVEWAQALAGAFGARLVVLHVVDLAAAAAVMGGPGDALVPPPASLLEEVRQDARQLMAELAARVPGATTLVREGSPRQDIIETCAEVKGDLIVMGTHGRSGLAHLLFGSVAEHVVRNAPVPVFTVRKGLKA